MGVPGGGDSVGWANLGDYLERIIDLDGLVAPVHPTSCMLTVALLGPARRQQSPGRRPEGASLTGARQRRLCPLLRLITREYRKRFVDLGRCVRQNFSQCRSDVLASVVSPSGELRPASGARGKAG